MDNEIFEKALPRYLVLGLEAWKKGVEGTSCQFYTAYHSARCKAMF